MSMTPRFVQTTVLAALLAATAAAVAESPPADADAFLIEVKDHTDLTTKLCAANPKVEHVIVLPASLFVDSQQVICSNGPYKLYRIVEHDDTDDFEYFLDPPSYSKEIRLGCDGKAGRTMKTIAVNCRPLD
jgi:hypothetical protein